MSMTSGIYKITNTKNGKFYVGSAANFSSRWSGHRHHLKRGTHSNKHLQSAWNTYGEQNFEFSVIKNVDPEYLLAEEQVYLDKWVGHADCYNIASSAESPGLGISPSKETRQKMSKSMSGRVRTKEHCENLSKSLMGNVISDETRLKISKTLTGKIESDETKKRKSLVWQGRTNNPDAKLTEADVRRILTNYEQNKNDRYYKMKLAKEYDVSWNTIHRIVIHEIWKHIGV